LSVPARRGKGMSLATKLEKNIKRILELDVERTKLETQLFYDPLLQRKDRAEQVQAMKQRVRLLFEQRELLWRESFGD
jgi:pyrimidine operon attenuation protein/uracil phosphoribosyltransferase